MKSMFLTMCALLMGLVIGCEKSEVQSTGPAEPLPVDLIVTTAPSGALDIPAAKQAAKDGEPIVVKGRVGGQLEPLAANRAIMTMSDLSLQTCDKIPGDTCKTPWDSCCEPTDQIAAKSVSIQVLNAEGKPLKAGLKGVGGIAPLKQIIVAGIARKGAANAMVVEAKQIYVVP